MVLSGTDQSWIPRPSGRWRYAAGVLLQRQSQLHEADRGCATACRVFLGRGLRRARRLNRANVVRRVERRSADAWMAEDCIVKVARRRWRGFGPLNRRMGVMRGQLHQSLLIQLSQAPCSEARTYSQVAMHETQGETSCCRRYSNDNPMICPSVPLPQHARYSGFRPLQTYRSPSQHHRHWYIAFFNARS